MGLETLNAPVGQQPESILRIAMESLIPGRSGIGPERALEAPHLPPRGPRLPPHRRLRRGGAPGAGL